MRFHMLAGFADEMEKICASLMSAGYMQSRRGTRPYRVSTLLGRESSPSLTEPNSLTQNPENDRPVPPQAEGGEDDGSASIGKTAESKKEKALGAFASARPYVAEGVKAGVPAALLGNIYGGTRGAKIFGAIGTTGGVVNQALKDWAEKNKRKRVARRILED